MRKSLLVKQLLEMWISNEKVKFMFYIMTRVKSIFQGRFSSSDFIKPASRHSLRGNVSTSGATTREKRAREFARRNSHLGASTNPCQNLNRDISRPLKNKYKLAKWSIIFNLDVVLEIRIVGAFQFLFSWRTNFFHNKRRNLFNDKFSDKHQSCFTSVGSRGAQMGLGRVLRKWR